MNKPKELHIEVSNNCQAKCAMCVRTGLELDIANLKLDWFKRNIDPSTLEKIMFCGNLGDPCMNKRLLDICQWLKEQNPEIVLGINTNGALQSPLWWTKIAETFTSIYDYVVFSIDGTEKTNAIYRKGVAWHRIMENAKAFIDAGGSAHWDMLVFQHNRHEVNECIAIAKNMGFSWFRVKESARWDVYPPGTDGLWPADNSWQYINSIAIDCEANRDQSRYYDAHGKEWPCCHMAEAYSMNGHEDIKRFSNTELLDNYTEQLTKSPYDICVKACGTTARTGQWRHVINLKE
jgi:MoaA/NifB/PqqE/SkfB family radical SAM enzyme